MTKTSDMSLIDRSCPICGTAAAQVAVSSTVAAETLGWDDLKASWRGLFRDKSFFSFARCGGCGLLYNQKYFQEGQLAELYGEMAANMDEVGGDAVRLTQRGYFDQISGYLTREGGYLELGPDVGHFAGHCAATGRFDHFWMVEPNRVVWPALTAAVAGHGAVEVLSGNDELERIPDGSLAFAAAIHVLDHITDPVTTLRQIRTKMAPGSRLMCVTHDERSLLARLLGQRWPAYCLQHPQIYNQHSIRALFAQAGFEVAFVHKSVNYFPLGFLLRQGLWATVRLDLKGLRLLDRIELALRLGNILTLAQVAA